MPKSITFFSRGKTPIYVNYVIAHNTQSFLTRQMQDSYPDRWQRRAARYALRVSRSVVVSLNLSRRSRI